MDFALTSFASPPGETQANSRVSSLLGVFVALAAALLAAAPFSIK
jgi:hypothetical protein